MKYNDLQQTQNLVSTVSFRIHAVLHILKRNVSMISICLVLRNGKQSKVLELTGQKKRMKGNARIVEHHDTAGS
jgi:hypothetical protein